MQAKTELLKVVVRQKLVKFIYSEKAAKFCEIFTFLLTTVHTVKRNVKISQNFVAFSEYMYELYLKSNCFHSFFFEELKTPKRNFEIN